MSIVQDMVLARIVELLADLEALSEDVAAYQREVNANPTVVNMIDSNGMSPDHLERMGIIQFQLVMLNAISGA